MSADKVWEDGVRSLVDGHFDRLRRWEEMERKALADGATDLAAKIRSCREEMERRHEETMDTWVDIGRARKEWREKNERRTVRAVTVVAVLFGLAGVGQMLAGLAGLFGGGR